jgi:hypothetical protein
MMTGTTASLRPAGIGRYFSAAFLSVWLVGWVIGEAVALIALAAILSSMSGLFSRQLPAGLADLVSDGGSGFVIIFLLIWLTFWTVGGIGAATHLLRSLFGEDLFVLSGSELEVVRRAGPFRRRYPFERSAIRRLRIRPRDKALVADTDRGTQVLSALGSPQEREGVRDWLGQYLHLPDENAVAATGVPPATWEVTIDGNTTYVSKVQPRVRKARSLISWLVTGAVAMGWLASLDADSAAGSIPALMLTLLVAVGAATSTWGRREWIVRPAELTFRWHLWTWTSERTFKWARLEVTHHTDSDDDSHYKLTVVDNQGRKAVHAQVNDSAEVVDLARWLAGRTGFPLSIST